MRIIVSTFLFTLIVIPSILSAQKPGNFETSYGQRDNQRDIRLMNAANINTNRLEFSPVLYGNGIVYVSQPQNGPRDEKTGETLYELFYSELDPNGYPVKPQNFSVAINSPKYEGPVSFNRKGDRIYFTRSNNYKGIAKATAKNKIPLKIYEAKKGFFDWEDVKALAFANDDYSYMHPALSPDGKKLFFASDRPDGYGKYDLYFVEQTPSGWSQPINLGPEINTDKNEVFPFFHDSGTLFFTSDGHSSLGGLDVFMIDLSDRVWGKVMNLGRPFNSEKDDLGFTLSPDGTRGYFSSNRDGGFGRDDIFFFEAPAGIKGIKLPELTRTLVTLYDAQTSKRITGAAVRIFEQAADGLVENEELYDLELVPNEAAPGQMKIELKRKKEADLGSPDLLTDRNGESVLQLEAQKNYLVLISKEGYRSYEFNYEPPANGRTRPLEIVMEASNCLNLEGTIVTDPYKLRIPNATVKITSSCNNEAVILNTNLDGVFEYCLEMGCDYQVVAYKDGYSEGSTEISTVKLRGRRTAVTEIKLAASSDQVLKEPIREGTVIVLDDIYYDFNKSAIRVGEARDLEAVAKLMKQYPSMEVELGAFTDCRGDQTYNLSLSLKRAESAKEFILSRGIANTRIKVFGYGEAFPRNGCVDGVECTEREHQYNRRTEIKVVKIDEPVNLNFYQDNGMGGQRN